MGLYNIIYTLTLTLLSCCITIETLHTLFTLSSCGIICADETLPSGSIAGPRDRGINVSIAFTRQARDCWWVTMETFIALITQWPCITTITSAQWCAIWKGSAAGPGGEGHGYNPL